MSIATLKRKTQTKYNNMSVGASNFSLSGTHRNQGYVGQTSLSRTILKTPHRGIYPRGHGGCCGDYTISIHKESTLNCLEDSTVIKRSTMNTKGLILSKYRWSRRPQPYAIVKPDYNVNNNDQGTYITKKAQNTEQSIRKANDPNSTECKGNVGSYTSSCANSTGVGSSSKTCTITKPESDYVAMSSGEHLSKVKDACIDNDETFSRPTLNTPFGRTYRTEE